MTKLYKLICFKITDGKGISGSDLEENTRHSIHLDLSKITYVSNIKYFRLPLSGTYTNLYAYIDLDNGKTVYIDAEEQVSLLDYISKTNEHKDSHIMMTQEERIENLFNTVSQLRSEAFGDRYGICDFTDGKPELEAKADKLAQ